MGKRRRITTKTKKQSGGYLEGPSHDNGGIPAYTPGEDPIELEGGEYIINAATTATLGTEFLDKLNRTQSPHHSEPGFTEGQLPGSNYAYGGIVKSIEAGNKNIKTGLPESYRKANLLGKSCNNCLFFRINYCKKWASNVNRQFLCNSWSGNKTTKIKIMGKR